CMTRAVLVQHHPRQRTALALPAVRALARRLGRHALPLKMQLGPSVAPPEAVVLHQMLMEMLDREALVALAIEPLHFLRPVRRDPLARRLAEPAVDKSGLAFLLISPGPAPQRPLAHPQKLRRLRLIELRRFPTPEKIQKHRHAHPLKGLRPAHPTPLSKGRTYRTDRALPKPDISSATDILATNVLRKTETYAMVIRWMRSSIAWPSESRPRHADDAMETGGEGALEPFRVQPETRVERKENFFIFFGRNSLKSPDSEK